MGLKLKELQKFVDNIVKEEKSVELLRNELLATLGPNVLTTVGLNQMALSANEILDIYEVNNKEIRQIKPSLLLKFSDSESAEVRRLIVRLLPESFLKQFATDASSSVRAAVARRLPWEIVAEIVRCYPHDEELLFIEEKKRLKNTLPKIINEPFDMYGSKPVGTIFDNLEDLDLTDSWYESTASNIIKKFGKTLESNWEELAVQQIYDAANSEGIEVDKQKLLDCVYSMLDSREEKIVDESLINVMPILSESFDAVENLVSSKLSSKDYIERFEKIYGVKYEAVQNPGYFLYAESLSEKIMCPVTADLPKNFIRRIDEKALDLYVAAWNMREKSQDQYRKLSWSPSALEENTVNFYLELL